MNIAAWVIQVLLAIGFGFVGSMKAFSPMSELAANMDWVNGVPAFVPRLAGIAELLGAIGMIVPAITRIQPKMTIYAAYGLIAVMALAAIMHITRSEWSMIPSNIILAGLAYFVAWVRTNKAPILPRS